VSEAIGASRSPAIRRRELDAYLRDLRLTRGLTVEQVAAELLCSTSKISQRGWWHTYELDYFATYVGLEEAANESFALLCVLDEAVLHRAVGGAHAAMESMFIILDFEHPMSNVVYVEGLIGFLYLERPQDIARYEQVFDRLLALALSPQDSIEFIRKVAMECRGIPT
jgi:hypothetical protein